MFQPQPISSTDARKYFTQIINKVQYSSKSFVVKSYRHPAVRIVKENYIATLEGVLGKKTINQILQIAGNDRLFESEKMEQIKKVFQRRLSGSPRQTPQPQKPRPPQQKPATPEHRTGSIETQKNVTKVAARHVHPEPNGSGASPKPKPNHPASNIKPQASEKRVLLLQNGKNYK